MLKASSVFEDVAGYSQTMAQYDPAATIASLTSLIGKFDSLNPIRVQGVAQAVGALNGIDTGKTWTLQNLITSINNISTVRLQKATEFLDKWR